MRRAAMAAAGSLLLLPAGVGAAWSRSGTDPAVSGRAIPDGKVGAGSSGQGKASGRGSMPERPGPSSGPGPTALPAFPDAKSTGVREGAVLRPVGDMTVKVPGTVVERLEIHGTLRIEANDVTVRDCRIVSDGDHGILIPDGSSGAVVEHSAISGPRNGISGTGTFRFNDISHVENGINVYGPSTITDNYIHDMSGGAEAHFDGIEINGGGGTTIRHNTIINDNGQTSAIMMGSDFGVSHDIVVDGNFLAGGGYTIYSRSPTNIITDNFLGQGHWGYYEWGGTGQPRMSGNHELGTTWRAPDSSGANHAQTPKP